MKLVNVFKRLWEIFTGEEFEDKGKACFYCHADLLDIDLEKHLCPSCGHFLKGEKVKGKKAREWRKLEDEAGYLLQ